MGIIPLSTSVNHDPEYITLKEALDKNQLTVKEVSHGGSVPELKVINKAEIPFLFLMGKSLLVQNKTWDYRYEGKQVVGSALLYRKKVIHMAFFMVTEGEKVGPMAGYSRRRGFRTD